MTISLDGAQRIVASDIATLILESIILGFEDYFNKVDEESRAICSATTRANFINDHMIYHARDKMKDHPNVRFITRYGRTHFLISEQVEVKLKKLNRNRQSSNILTQEVLDYNAQIPLPLRSSQQLAFPNFPNPQTANLIAGYQLNRIKTNLEAVYIVCPQGSRNRWEWKLEFALKPSIVAEPQPVGDSSKPKVIIPKKKLVKDQIV